MDLVRAYRLYQKMMTYPELIADMRTLFLEALTDQGITNQTELEKEAREMLAGDWRPVDEVEFQETVHALIDLYFAKNFSQEEVEGYINLARKKDRFKVLYRVVNTEGVTSEEIKAALKAFCDIPQGDLLIDPREAEGVRVALIHHFISSQLPFLGIAKNYLTIRDIDEMIKSTYSIPRRPGKIGGKAAGMLLANKIVLPRLLARDPELEKSIVQPESWYFDSGVFSEFVDTNHLYQLHSFKYLGREALEEEAVRLAPLIEKADFPEDVIQTFRTFLEHIGPAPLILRSSSLLEDSFGYAFSGKYQSVFLANQGDLSSRLKEFIAGLKQVFSSTWSLAPIIYRRDHNLLDFDERMSVLVQKVIGRRFGDYFFPFCAGVAFSRNIYPWTPRLDPADGLVRLVFGLGTRAVDRIGGDYPRMIGLSHPTLRPEVETEQIKKYSQKMVDALNLASGQIETLFFPELIRKYGHPDLFLAVSVDRGGLLNPMMFKGESLDPDSVCLTFANLLAKTNFPRLMRKALKKLQDAYGRPVDVEFAFEDDRLYLLQCRSLALRQEIGPVALPDNIPTDRILFTNDRGISSGVIEDIEYLVYVDPKAYNQLPTFEKKIEVARTVSLVNRSLQGSRFILFGPGRWGSNDINLGVKVGYQDINYTRALGEIAFAEKGSTPQVSHGTHFFSDLVEAGIIPIALYPDQPGTIFREDFFVGSSSCLKAILQDRSVLNEVIRVIHIPSTTGGMRLHILQDGEGQKGIGFLAPPKRNSLENQRHK